MMTPAPTISTVRAWQVSTHGSPVDVASLLEIPTPVPTERQLLVRVAAVGLNLPDILHMEGRYQDRPQLPFTPGFEFSGVVDDRGALADIPIGTRVLCISNLPTGSDGGLAELVTVDDDSAFAIPDSMTFVDAAALSVTYATAHLALAYRGRLLNGETVLVHGGAGGVGTAAIQLAIASGATVLATASGPEKVALCQALGARTVDIASDDFVEFVKAETDGRGVHVVVDPVGGRLFEESRRVLADGARILVIGFSSGSIGTFSANQVLLKNFSVVGVNRDLCRRRQPAAFARLHAELFEMYDADVFRPVIAARVPFEDALDGWRLLSDRASRGKVVVTIPDRRRDDDAAFLQQSPKHGLHTAPQAPLSRLGQIDSDHD